MEIPHACKIKSKRIHAFKTRELPTCDIEIRHRSTSFCLLGNIAYRTGERLEWDANKEIITNSSAGNNLLSYDYRAPLQLPKV